MALLQQDITGVPAPKARNYQGDLCMLVSHSAKHLFASASADGPYANRAHMMMVAQESFEIEWDERLPLKNLQLPEPDYFAMLVNRTATQRGDFRNRVRSIAQINIGQFIHPPMTEEDIQFNIK